MNLYKVTDTIVIERLVWAKDSEDACEIFFKDVRHPYAGDLEVEELPQPLGVINEV